MNNAPFASTTYSALLQAMAYIRFVQARSPEIHAQADGSPSITEVVFKALQCTEAPTVKPIQYDGAYSNARIVERLKQSLKCKNITNTFGYIIEFDYTTVDGIIHVKYNTEYSRFNIRIGDKTITDQSKDYDNVPWYRTLMDLIYIPA